MSLTNEQIGTQLASLIAQYSPSADATARQTLLDGVADLFEQAGLVLPTALRDTLAQHVDVTEQWIVQFRAWAVGTHDGGPNRNGEYPLVDRNGSIVMLASPAKIRSELFGLTPRGMVDTVEALDELTGVEVGDVYTDREEGHAWVWSLDGEWMDLGKFRGPSVFQIWVALPENTGKTEADYFRWLADAQKSEVQPLLDAALAARDDARTAHTGAEAARTGAEDALAGAEAARDVATEKAADSAASAVLSDEKKIAAEAARAGAVDAEAGAVAAKDISVAAKGASLDAKGVAVAKAGEATDQARTATEKAQEAAGSASTATDKAAAAEAARLASVAAQEAAEAVLGETEQARDTTLQAKSATFEAREATEAARDLARAALVATEAARDEAQEIAGGNFQVSDPTLTEVAKWSWTSGKVIFALTGEDAFTPLKIGASGATDVLDRQSADSRYRLKSTAITIGEVTGLQTALDAKATPEDIQEAIDDLKAGAPALYDTLGEIAQKLQNDDDVTASILGQISTKAAQADLTAVEQELADLQARPAADAERAIFGLLGMSSTYDLMTL